MIVFIVYGKEEKMKEDVLKPFGSLDVLYFYSKVAASPKMKKFLGKQEIATKIWLPDFFFLKRGSKAKPLFVEDFSNVNEKMLKLRAKSSLKEARSQLTDKQQLLWEYFVPRKLVDFLYACNGEKQGKPIHRIFMDIDKGKTATSEQAQEVAQLLVKTIKSDKQFNKIVKYKIFLMWTGNSFHVYLLLKNKQPLSFYNKYISFSKNAPLESFTGRWAFAIDKQVSFKVKGGHEKIGGIVIDPSNTPSGKLARCPFSLHMKSDKQIDGIAVPISEKDLQNKNLIKTLKALTTEKVLKDFNQYIKLLP